MIRWPDAPRSSTRTRKMRSTSLTSSSSQSSLSIWLNRWFKLTELLLEKLCRHVKLCSTRSHPRAAVLVRKFNYWKLKIAALLWNLFKHSLTVLQSNNISYCLTSFKKLYFDIGCFNGHWRRHARGGGPQQVPDSHPAPSEDRPVRDNDAGWRETRCNLQRCWRLQGTNWQIARGKDLARNVCFTPLFNSDFLDIKLIY